MMKFRRGHIRIFAFQKYSVLFTAGGQIKSVAFVETDVFPEDRRCLHEGNFDFFPAETAEERRFRLAHGLTAVSAETGVSLETVFLRVKVEELVPVVLMVIRIRSELHVKTDHPHESGIGHVSVAEIFFFRSRSGGKTALYDGQNRSGQFAFSPS